MGAHHAGLLKDADAIRFEEHISRCRTCRDAWEKYRQVDEEDAQPPNGHIPTSLMARWETVRDELRGLERAMVRQHLERCADCRQDLEVLGHTPVLERDSALEGEVDPGMETSIESDASTAADQPTSDGEETKGRPVQLVLRVPRPARQGWLRWASAGWAVAATAAVFLLVLLPGSERETTRPSREVVMPWVTPQLVRGNERGTPLELAAPPRTIAVAVRIPPGFLVDAEAFVQVFSPGNDLLLTTPLDDAYHDRSTALVLLDGAAPLDAGSYRVLLWPGEPTNPSITPVETRFELRIVAGP
jgi:hypothetical protein